MFPSDPRPGVRKRPTSWLVELGFSGDISLVVLAVGGLLDGATQRLITAGSGETHESDRPPKVEYAEDQSNHDDVPGAMTDGPWGQE